MWFAVWVQTGHEEKVLKMCQKGLVDQRLVEACFLPKYERAWKEKGKWGKKEELLFPGYIFMVSKYPELLVKALREIPEFAKVLGDEEGPIPLYEQEVEFLERYTNQNRVLEMSTGILKGQELVITDGPLKEYKGKVIHIDRHKRQATLEMEFFGRIMTMKVGLEVVRKVE